MYNNNSIIEVCMGGTRTSHLELVLQLGGHCTVEPHLSEPRVSGCSDYPALMVAF